MTFVVNLADLIGPPDGGVVIWIILIIAVNNHWVAIRKMSFADLFDYVDMSNVKNRIIYLPKILRFSTKISN